jgi:hypothetical protein
MAGPQDRKTHHGPQVNNLADPFTKTLTEKVFSSHVEYMGVRLGNSDL